MTAGCYSNPGHRATSGGIVPHYFSQLVNSTKEEGAQALNLLFRVILNINIMNSVIKDIG
jgi:hypothetical protein